MKRERYIDIVKGLSILCIVFLHYEDGVLPQTVNVFIGSFMITAFYVTSGWISAMTPSHLSLRALMKKRWRQLGVPYLWWSAIILFFDIILLACGYYDVTFIGREVYKTIVLRGIGTLWFLPALFFGEIIWYWLRGKNRWIRLIALVFTIVYQYLYHNFFNGKLDIIYRIIDAPFRTISNILGAWVGIAFGYYAYIYLSGSALLSKRRQLKFWGIIICTIAFIAANYLPLKFSILWGYIAPLLGPLGWLLLAKSIQESRLLNYFDYWGRHSLILMITHYSVVLVLCIMIVEKWFELPFSGWITILCFVLSMIVQYLLVKPIERYLGFTLGR